MPRPLQGWRVFIGEVGVIILGVLIALGLGAAASEIGWKIDTQKARRAMGLELGEAIGQGLERVRVYDCVEKRLDEIAQIVAKASIEGRLPPVGDLGLPPRHTWNRGIWESTITSASAAHFDREQLAVYASAYEYVAAFRETSDEESGSWVRLYSLVGPGREFSSSEATDLYGVITQARVANRRMARRGLLLSKLVDSYDLYVDEAYMEENLKRERSAYPVCQPPGPVPPPGYGQAPQQLDLERLDRNANQRIPLKN